MNPPRITIVGCGPGSPEYLTDAARQAVAAAEVLFGSPRLLKMFDEGPCLRLAVDGDIASLLEKIAEQHAAGRRVVVLVSGDPGVFSLARNILERFGRESCEVVSGVSSVQVAFARLGLDWSNARIESAHGRTPRVAPEELACCDKLAILAGSSAALQWAARVADVLGSSHDVYLCENLTLPDERVRLLLPGQLAEVAAASLSIVLLIRRTEGP